MHAVYDIASYPCDQAIWLLPRYNSYGAWPCSGEIDLIETRGNGPEYEHGGVDSMGSTLHWVICGDGLTEDACGHREPMHQCTFAHVIPRHVACGDQGPNWLENAWRRTSKQYRLPQGDDAQS